MIRFSKSKLNTFIACPEKYYLHYELGVRATKTSRTLVEGSCIHHLVESGLMFRNNMSDVLQQASRNFWNDHPRERCDYEDDVDYLAAQDLCLRQSIAFLEQLGPLQTISVELHLESNLINPITLEEDFSISLIGYIDLVIRDLDGNPWLIDLKTVKKSPREGMSKVALELSMYSYLYSVPFNDINIPAIPVALIYLIRTKTPQVKWDESRRSLGHYVDLHATCKSVADLIQQGHFWRNPGLHCSYCDMSSLCYGEDAVAIEVFGEEGLESYRANQSRRDTINLEDLEEVAF